MAERKKMFIIIAYHIDRVGSLPLGEVTISKDYFGCMNSNNADYLRDFFIGGISKAGEIYVKSFDKANEMHTLSIIETIFEYVRSLYFNDKPSRFQSVFACETMEDVESWAEYFKCVGELKIRRIEFHNYCKCDAMWRDICRLEDYFVPSVVYYCAKQYWSGAISPNPRLELVIPLPVLVLE